MNLLFFNWVAWRGYARSSKWGFWSGFTTTELHQIPFFLRSYSFLSNFLFHLDRTHLFSSRLSFLGKLTEKSSSWCSVHLFSLAEGPWEQVTSSRHPITFPELCPISGPPRGTGVKLGPDPTSLSRFRDMVDSILHTLGLGRVAEAWFIRRQNQHPPHYPTTPPQRYSRSTCTCAR